MTRVHDIIYPDNTGFVDNGNGNGVWEYTFTSGQTIPDYSDPALYTRQGGEFVVKFYGSGTVSGTVTINGHVVCPDLSVFGSSYSRTVRWLTILEGNPVVTVEVTGCDLAGGWDNVNEQYRAYYTRIYPIVWLNPLTGGLSSSFEGGHLYDGTSDVTCPGYENTVVNNYQVWGMKGVTVLRMRQRNDAQGRYEGHSRIQRGGEASSAATTSPRVPGGGQGSYV